MGVRWFSEEPGGEKAERDSIIKGRFCPSDTFASGVQFGDCIFGHCHSEPVLSARNLFSTGKTADSSRDTAALRNDNCE